MAIPTEGTKLLALRNPANNSPPARAPALRRQSGTWLCGATRLDAAGTSAIRHVGIVGSSFTSAGRSWTGPSVHDILGVMSYKPGRKRAITVRVPEARLKQVMRARGIATQSELFNTLLDEEVEKMIARKALEATAGKLGAKDFDDRLL